MDNSRREQLEKRLIQIYQECMDCADEMRKNNGYISYGRCVNCPNGMKAHELEEILGDKWANCKEKMEYLYKY